MMFVLSCGICSVSTASKSIYMKIAIDCGLWSRASWSGATYRWHPTGEAPPVMGLVFRDAEAGRGIFRAWVEENGHEDKLDDLCVSIIEGPFPNMPPGYIVHLGPNPKHLLAHIGEGGVALNADALGKLCRANWMDLLPGNPPMLATFKREFKRHGTCLLAPVTQRDDGQYWVDVELGIEKTAIHFYDYASAVADIKSHGVDIEAVIAMLGASGSDGKSGPPDTSGRA